MTLIEAMTLAEIKKLVEIEKEKLHYYKFYVES